jgi:hypothetical protein
MPPSRAPRPSKAQKPRRAAAPERCQYVEGGTRCRRNGTGSPSLCRAHRLAAEEAARRPRSATFTFIDGIMNGERVSSETVFDAINEVFMGIFGGMGRPGATRVPNPFPGGSRPRREPPPAPPPEKFDPNGTDPRAVAARRTLGFDNIYLHLSAEDVTKRRRELARKYHPDHASDERDRVFRTAKMADINAAADLLLGAFG